MPDSSSPAPAPAAASFESSDVIALAQALGSLVVSLDPAAAGVVAIATGAANLLRNTVLPAIQHFQAHEISVVEQATEQAEAATERLRVGAPPAADN